MSKITVETTINADAKTVWHHFTAPEHIVNWNFASDDWHCPKATNDLRVGGKLCSTMAARDGSMSFDFEGVYTRVDPPRRLAFTLEDGRTVEVTLSEQAGKTTLTETFDAENQNPEEMQRAGWQMILENFKKYTEGKLS